jgi:hypothetical protein
VYLVPVLPNIRFLVRYKIRENWVATGTEDLCSEESDFYQFGNNCMRCLIS